jgi:O-acetyl-ADP-ribose deacetylase (regulator of RNase III)
MSSSSELSHADIIVSGVDDLVLNPHSGLMEKRSGNGCPFASMNQSKEPAATHLVLNPHTGTKEVSSGGCPFMSQSQVTNLQAAVPREENAGPEELSVKQEGEEGDDEGCPYASISSENRTENNSGMERCPFVPSSLSQPPSQSSSDAPASVVNLSAEEWRLHDADMLAVPLEHWALFCSKSLHRTRYFQAQPLSLEDVCAKALRKIDFQNSSGATKNIILSYHGVEELMVDAVVNGINEELSRELAQPTRIYHAAGSNLMNDVSKLVSSESGDMLLTKGYDLPSLFVINVSVPKFISPDEIHVHNAKIENCYTNCLRMADERGHKTIAIPPLGCGASNYPTETHSMMILKLVLNFLRGEAKSLEHVILCFNDDEMAFLYQMHFTSLMELVWFP